MNPFKNNVNTMNPFKNTQYLLFVAIGTIFLAVSFFKGDAKKEASDHESNIRAHARDIKKHTVDAPKGAPLAWAQNMESGDQSVFFIFADTENQFTPKEKISILQHTKSILEDFSREKKETSIEVQSIRGGANKNIEIDFSPTFSRIALHPDNLTSFSQSLQILNRFGVRGVSITINGTPLGRYLEDRQNNTPDEKKTSEANKWNKNQK